MKAIAIGFPLKSRLSWQIILDIKIYFQNHPKRVLENSRKISIFIASYERPPEIRLLTEISRLLNAALFSKEVNLNCHSVCPILSQPPLVGPFNYLFETFIMKRIYLLFSFAFLSAGIYAQLTIQSGATFFIQGGATVTVQGDVTSLADIQGTGLLQMKGSSLQTVNMNGFSIPNIEIDNASNVALGGAATIGSSFLFTTGKVQLNGFDLSLASAATLTGYDNSKYFVTNSTGRLVRNSLVAAFTYPVGFDVSTYNPVTLTQAGTTDNIGVRCLQNVLSGGTAGSPFVKEVVDASWAVTEAVAGGSNLTMTSAWNGTDELTGFNRAKTGISYYDGIGWDMTNLVTGAAAGAGPYTITRSSVSNLANGGIFAVGTRPVLTALLVSPKMYLQGPTYAAGNMSDGIRLASLIPLTEPYTGLSNFTHSGSGGGETIPSGILSTTGTGNDIVDWGFAQLHNGGGAVIATRAVLFERDGDIVDVDGLNVKTPYLNFAGETAVGGPYYVSIRHRNSLGARSAGTFALSRTITTPIDFTTSLASAFSGAVPNNAMATISAGVFGLWGGNANSDLFTRRVGSSTTNDYSLLLNYLGVLTQINGVYRREDFNMDGNVRRTGSASTNDYSKLLSILSSFTTITQPTF